MILEAYIGLFLSAFLAATILPVVSEAVIAGLAASGAYSTLWLLVVASVGNTLGSVVNWLLGRFLIQYQYRGWFPVKPRHLERASRVFNRWGVWSLLLAWTPFLGDPLTFVAGVLRVPFLLFLVLVAVSKTGRYVVLLGLVEQIFP
jgi:membrane protein YqaA with SNARE-associated domain